MVTDFPLEQLCHYSQKSQVRRLTISEAGLGDLFMFIKQQWALKKTTSIHLS